MPFRYYESCYTVIRFHLLTVIILNCHGCNCGTCHYITTGFSAQGNGKCFVVLKNGVITNRDVGAHEIASNRPSKKNQRVILDSIIIYSTWIMKRA